MRLFHITPMDNLSSICKTGLRPYYPRLKSHQICFKKLGLPKKLIYAWPAARPKTIEKLAKDVAYWRVWGWRLNDMVKAGANSANKNLANRARPPVEPDCFAILTFDKTYTGAENPLMGFVHVQHPDESSPCYSTMDIRYTHHQRLFLIDHEIAAEELCMWGCVWTEVKRADRRWNIDVHLHRFRTASKLVRAPRV